MLSHGTCSHREAGVATHSCARALWAVLECCGLCSSAVGSFCAQSSTALHTFGSVGATQGLYSLLMTCWVNAAAGECLMLVCVHSAISQRFAQRRPKNERSEAVKPRRLRWSQPPGSPTAPRPTAVPVTQFRPVPQPLWDCRTRTTHDRTMPRRVHAAVAALVLLTTNAKDPRELTLGAPQLS